MFSHSNENSNALSRYWKNHFFPLLISQPQNVTCKINTEIASGSLIFVFEKSICSLSLMTVWYLVIIGISIISYLNKDH